MQNFLTPKVLLYSPVPHRCWDTNDIYMHVWFMWHGNSGPERALWLLSSLKWPSSGISEVAHTKWIQIEKKKKFAMSLPLTCKESNMIPSQAAFHEPTLLCIVALPSNSEWFKTIHHSLHFHSTSSFQFSKSTQKLLWFFLIPLSM